MRVRGDVDVFEIDPEALLRRFPGQQRVRVGFRAPDGDRLRTRAWIDLEALSAELAEAAQLAPMLDGDHACADTIVDLPKEADLGQYECTVTESDSTTSLFVWTGRIMWQYRVSPNLYFEANLFGSVDEASPATLFQGRLADIMLRVTYPGAYRKRSGFTVELGTGAQALTFPIGENLPDWNRMREVLTWDRARALEGGGNAIPLVVRDSRGSVAERVELPPALFSGVEQRVRVLLRHQKVMMEDRLDQCEPPQDSIIT